MYLFNSCAPSHNSSTLANWKAHFQAIHDGITGIGWVQTSDTGQTDITSEVSVPTVAGKYKVYRADDALQSVLPLFFRLDLYATTVPALAITFGTQTDGAGLISRNNMPALPFYQTVTTALYHNMFTGDEGNIAFAMSLDTYPNPSQTANNGATNMFMMIERGKNYLGDDVGDFASFLCCCASSSMNPCYGVVGKNLSHTYRVNSKFPCLFPSDELGTGGISYYGKSIGFSPYIPWTGRSEYPSKLLAFSRFNETASMSSVSLKLYGQTVPYRVAQNAGRSTFYMAATGGPVNFLLREE
jgi:hypothetical protein